MTKMNGILISFILIVNLIYCSNSITSFFTNKFETDTDSESAFKLCGVFEGRLNLVVYNKDKKLVSSSLRVNFDSDNFSFFNQEKKTLIQNFKMEDLQKINKIPLIRPVNLDSNTNCFELIFKNSNKKAINLNLIPITLCSGNIDEKLNFLKQIVNKKQCQLNRIYRQKNGTDRNKVLENYDIINKLLDERKKKLLDLRNNYLNKNETGTCCIKETDTQENQLTLDKDLLKLKKIKNEMQKEYGKDGYNKYKNNSYDEFITKRKEISKEDYHRNLLLDKILDIKKELDSKLGKNVYFRDDEKEIAKRNRALEEFMKNLFSKNLKDLLNEYKNLIEKEKQKALKSNEDLLNYLKKIEQMPKGNFKMCIPKNTSNMNYKNQIKNTCISIYGIDKIDKVHKCINDKNKFCKLCCDKYANLSENKLNQCQQGCKKSINKAELDSVLDNSLDNLSNKLNQSKIQSKENNEKRNEIKKDNENKSLINGLLNAYKKKINEKKSQYDSKNNKEKNLQDVLLKQLDDIDKLKSDREKQKSFKKKFITENLKFNNKSNSDSELDKLLEEERRKKKRLDKNKKQKDDQKKNQDSNLLLKELMNEYKNRKNLINIINKNNLGEGKYSAIFKGNLTNIKTLKPEESELLKKFKQDKQNEKLLDEILNKMRNDNLSKFEKNKKKYDLLRRIFENKIKKDRTGKTSKRGQSGEKDNEKYLDINTLKNLQADENLKKLLPEYFKEKPSKAKIKSEINGNDLINSNSSSLTEAGKNKKIIDDLLNEVKNKSISKINKEKKKNQNDQDEYKNKQNYDLSLEYLLFGKKNQSLNDYLNSKIKSNTKLEKEKYREREKKPQDSLEKLLGLGEKESLEEILRRKNTIENKKNKTRVGKVIRNPSLEELLYGKGDSSEISPYSKSIKTKKKEKKATYDVDSLLSNLLPGFSDSRKGKLIFQNKDNHKLNESIKNNIVENIYKLRSNSYFDELKKKINNTLINEIANSLKNKYSSLDEKSNSLKNKYSSLDEKSTSLKNNTFSKYSNINGNKTSTTSQYSKIKHLKAEDLFGKLDTETENRLKNLNTTNISKDPLSLDDLSPSEAEKIKTEFENSKKSVSPNCIDILINDDSENIIDFSKMKNFGNCTDSHTIKKTSGPKYNSKDLTTEVLIKSNKKRTFNNQPFEINEVNRIKELSNKNDLDYEPNKNINNKASDQFRDKQYKKFNQYQKMSKKKERKINDKNDNKRNKNYINKKEQSNLREERKKNFYTNEKINQNDENKGREFSQNYLNKVDNKRKNYDYVQRKIKYNKNKEIIQNVENIGTQFNQNNITKFDNKKNINYDDQQGLIKLSVQGNNKNYKNKDNNQNIDNSKRELSQNNINKVDKKRNFGIKFNNYNLAGKNNRIVDEFDKPELNEECKDKIITEKKINSKNNSLILIYNIQGNKLYLDLRENKVIYKSNKGKTSEFNKKKQIYQTKNIQKHQLLNKILNNLNSTLIKDKIKSFIINSNFSSVFSGKSQNEYEKTIKKFLKNNKNFREKLINSLGNETCSFGCNNKLNISLKNTYNKFENQINDKNTKNLNSSQLIFEKKFFDNSDILLSKFNSTNNTSKENTIELQKNCNFSEIIKSLRDPNNGPGHNSLDFINTDSNSTSLKKCDSDIQINTKNSNNFNKYKCKDKIRKYKIPKFLLNNNSNKIYLNKTLNKIKKIKFQDLTFDNITKLMKLFKREKQEKLKFLSKIDRLIQIKNLLEESCDQKALEITNIFYKGIIYKLKYLKENKKRLRDFTLVIYDFNNTQKNLESKECSNNNGFKKLIRLEIQKNLNIIHKLIIETPYECLNVGYTKETSKQDFNEKCQKLHKAKILFDKLILNKTRFSILIKIISKLKNLRMKLLGNINKLYKNKESFNTTKELDIYNPKKVSGNKINKTFLFNSTSNHTGINRRIIKKLPLKVKINNEIKNLLKILRKKEGKDYHFSFKNLKNLSKIQSRKSLKNINEIKNSKSTRFSNSIQYKDPKKRDSINKNHKNDTNILKKQQTKKILIDDKCEDFIISARLKKFCFYNNGNLKLTNKNKIICGKLQKFLFKFNIKKLAKSEMKIINLPTDSEIFRALKLKENCGKKVMVKLNSKIKDLKDRCLEIKNSLLDNKDFDSKIKTKEVSICFARLEKFNNILKSKFSKCKKYKQIIRKLKNGFKNDTFIQNSLDLFAERKNSQLANMYYNLPNTNCTIENSIKPVNGPSYDWEDYLTNEILDLKSKNIKNTLKKVIPQCKDKIQKLKNVKEIEKTKNNQKSKNSRMRTNYKDNYGKNNCTNLELSDHNLRISGPEYFHQDIIMSKSLMKKIKKYEEDCKNKEKYGRLDNLSFERKKNERNTGEKNSTVINGPKETTQDLIIDSINKNERIISKIKKSNKCYKLKNILENEIEKRKNFRFVPFKCKDLINKKKAKTNLIISNTFNKNTQINNNLIKLQKKNKIEKILKQDEFRKRTFGLQKLKPLKELDILNKQESNLNLNELNSECKKLKRRFTKLIMKTKEKFSKIINGPNLSAEDVILDKATITLANKCLKSGIFTNQFIKKILN